jgi:ABC-type phosphate/phosphonate transport system substrate-binding protein
MGLPVANARMYSATPRVKQAWDELLHWVLADADLQWAVLDHAAPAPMADLWAREDLGLAMMCGLPFAQRVPAARLIAAPVPRPARYGGRPVYCTDIVVRSDSSYRTLEDTFGGDAGYTVADSLSGAVAFRHHLQAFRTPQRPRLYQRWVGGLLNARGVIDALARGDIDVGPLDSYYHDLLRHDEPEFAGRVRTIASTPFTPIPPLVATQRLSDDEVARLRWSLQRADDEPELQSVLARLLLQRFAVPDPADYAVLDRIARETPSLEDAP